MNGDKIPATGDPRRRDCAGGSDQLTHSRDRGGFTAVQYADLSAGPVDLAQVVTDPDHRAAEGLQHVPQLGLQLPFEVAVQRRQGLVQQDGAGLRRQDSCQGGALLLPTGELAGQEFFCTFQPQLGNQLRRPLPPPGFFQPPETDGDILFYGHLGKEGVLLEEIAYLPLLGG